MVDLEGRADPYALFVSPRALRRHVQRLQAWGYTFATFGRLAELAATGAARGVVALTFDDGLADNARVALPVLESLGVVATVFVVSSWVGGFHPETPWAPILSSDELRRLHESGWEIGSHTASHADLTTLAYDRALEEWVGSRAELEAMAGTEVHVAAYPWGRTNETARRACADAGYTAACCISGEGSWSDPFSLPRQDMGPGATLLGLRLKRDDRYEPLMARRSVRAVRRLIHNVRRP